MKKFLLEIEKLNKQDQFLCCVSGGQDSIVTLFVLLHLLKKNPSLQILYCQHFWQTKNFFSSFLIFRLSFLIQVPYTVILSETRVVSENRSRNWRRKNFFRLSQFEKISTLITGHTQTDILETNLNNLLRGTSPRGTSQGTLLNYKKTVGHFFSYFCLKQKEQNSCFSESKNLIHVENSKVAKRNLSRFIKFNRYQKTKFFGKGETAKKISIKLKDVKPTKKFKLKKNSFFFYSHPSQKEKRFFDYREKIHQRVDFSRYYARKLSFSKISIEKNSLFDSSASFCFCSKNHKIPINSLKLIKTKHRELISKMVSFYKLPLICDLTNFNSQFSRNKIRHQIFPFFKFVFHKKIESLFARFFQTLSIEYQNIEKQILYFTKISELSLIKKSNCSKILKKFNLQNPKLKRNWFFKRKTNQVRAIFLKRSYLNSFLVQKLIKTYSDLELNYSQISNLKEFLFVKNNKLTK